MTFYKTIILVVLFLAVVAVSFAFVAVFLGEKQINGRVIDALSGKPLSAVTIQIGASQLVSNEQGKFITYSQQYKQIPLQVAAAGYLPVNFTFDVPWYLRSGEVDIKLVPYGLSVQLLDEWTNEPLDQVALQIADKTIITDQAGMAYLDEFTIMPPVSIIATYPGYVSQQIELTRLPQDSNELPLKIKLTPHVLSGVVIASDTNQPMANVKVIIDDTTQYTDEAGQFSFVKILLGTSVEIVPEDNFLPVSFTFTGQSDVSLSIHPTAVQVVVVDDFSKQAVVGAQVRVLNQVASTNQQGYVEFKRVSSEGEMQVIHPGYLPTTVTYNNATLSTILLKPSAIQGVVRDATTGEALPNTELWIDNQRLFLSSNGRYELTNLLEPFTLTLRHLEYKTVRLHPDKPNNSLHDYFETIKTQPCQQPPQNLISLCLDLLLQPFSAQAIYIPFGLLSRPNEIYALFDFVNNTELNAVVIDVKGDVGKLAWDSQVLQADLLGIDGNREDWMLLKTFISEARKRDIYTIARMVIFKDNPLAFGNTDLAILKADGTVWVDGEGLAWANPFREEVWNYNIALAKEVAAMGFDEINLDYIRFPSDGSLASIAYIQENTAETRTTAIRTFISRMDDALAAYPVYISADVFGLTVWVDPESDMNIGQRIIDIAPYVDYLAPMIYPSTFVPGNLGYDDPSAYPYEIIFESQTKAASLMPPTTKVRPWLQAYWYDTSEMLLQKQAANDANSAGWFWWNAAGVYDDDVFEREY